MFVLVFVFFVLVFFCSRFFLFLRFYCPCFFFVFLREYDINPGLLDMSRSILQDRDVSHVSQSEFIQMRALKNKVERVSCEQQGNYPVISFRQC